MCTNSRDNLAKFDAFLNADSPELIAKVAVRFDGVAAVEQSHEVGGRKAVLQLLTPALRASRQERDSWTHRQGI
jgi:hypothetical protein